MVVAVKRTVAEREVVFSYKARRIQSSLTKHKEYDAGLNESRQCASLLPLPLLQDVFHPVGAEVLDGQELDALRGGTQKSYNQK